MKKAVSIFLFLFAALAIITVPFIGNACTVCHSKNPNMVRMHEALGYKDCFTCHGPSSKRTAGDNKEEMAKDPLCTICHERQTTTKK